MRKLTTAVSEQEIEEMRKYLEYEVEVGLLEPFREFSATKVLENEFGDTLGSRDIIYKIKLESGRETFAVDGGFLLDENGRFAGRGKPQRFKSIYPQVPNEYLADKLHLYLVAKICEDAGAVPKGGAEDLAQILDIPDLYKSMTFFVPNLFERADPSRN